MTSENKTCLHCSEPITHGTARRLYCNDKCRHDYQTAKRRQGLDQKKSNDPEPEDLAAIVEADKQESRAKRDSKYWQRRYEVAVRTADIQDLIMETIRDAVEPIPVLKPTPMKAHVGMAKGRHTAVVLLSDLHIGEKVDKEQTGGLSEFDMDIFRNRLGLWVDKVLELVSLRRSALYIPDLTVLLAGDIVSGDIHDELVKTNLLNVMDQSVQGALLISHALAMLSPHFENIHVVGVVGNHGRTTRKKETKDIHLSWDHIAYQLMASYLRGYERMSFHIPKAFYTIVDIENTQVLLLHGDNIKGWAGFPWYGISRATRSLRETFAADGRSFDVVTMGHFHNALELDTPTGPLIVNGSFKGGDEFSVSRVYAANRPVQTLFLIHEDFGVVARELLFLDRATDEHGSRFPSVIPEIWADAIPVGV